MNAFRFQLVFMVFTFLWSVQLPACMGTVESSNADACAFDNCEDEGDGERADGGDDANNGDSTDEGQAEDGGDGDSESAPAVGSVKLWDTKVKEIGCCKISGPGVCTDPGCWAYNLWSSLSWKNKDNWYQVPRGTTNYSFTGNIMVETDNYFYFFHTNTKDGPFYFPKYPFGIIDNQGHWGSEQYGGAILEDGTSVRNYNFNSIKEIVKNSADEVILIVDAGGFDQQHITDTAIVNYRFKDLYVELTPFNDYRYTHASHSQSGSVIGVSNTAGVPDWVSFHNDITVCPSCGGQYFNPPATANLFMIQPMQMTAARDQSILFLEFYDDPATARPFLSATSSRGYKIFEQFGVSYISRVSGNPACWFSSLQFNRALIHNASYSRTVEIVEKSSG